MRQGQWLVHAYCLMCEACRRGQNPSGMRSAAWRNPTQPSDTPETVGDGMAGKTLITDYFV